MSGLFYLITVTALSAAFIISAWKLKYTPQPDTAIKTFKLSIYHLMLLFVALLVDHYFW